MVNLAMHQIPSLPITVGINKMLLFFFLFLHQTYIVGTSKSTHDICFLGEIKISVLFS